MKDSKDVGQMMVIPSGYPEHALPGNLFFGDEGKIINWVFDFGNKSTN